MRAYKPEDIWTFVNKNGPVFEARPDLGPCWLWAGPIDPINGYGRVYGGSRRRPAHRIVFELSGRKIPCGRQLDHLCRVRHCVNPRHLEPVTGKTNILRGLGAPAQNARKTHCPEGHPYNQVERRKSGEIFRVCGPCKNRKRGWPAQYEALEQLRSKAP